MPSGAELAFSTCRLSWKIPRLADDKSAIRQTANLHCVPSRSRSLVPVRSAAHQVFQIFGSKPAGPTVVPRLPASTVQPFNDSTIQRFTGSATLVIAAPPHRTFPRLPVRLSAKRKEPVQSKLPPRWAWQSHPKWISHRLKEIKDCPTSRGENCGGRAECKEEFPSGPGASLNRFRDGSCWRVSAVVAIKLVAAPLGLLLRFRRGNLGRAEWNDLLRILQDWRRDVRVPFTRRVCSLVFIRPAQETRAPNDLACIRENA